MPLRLKTNKKKNSLLVQELRSPDPLIGIRIDRETYQTFRLVCMAKGIKPQKQLELLADRWRKRNTDLLMLRAGL